MKAFFAYVIRFPRRLVSLPIRLYRKFISPAKASPSCRFTPTCSAYALEAVEEWGVVIGLCLALWRVLRCNPFGKGGYDPVPRRKMRNKEAREKGRTDSD